MKLTLWVHNNTNVKHIIIFIFYISYKIKNLIKNIEKHEANLFSNK